MGRLGYKPWELHKITFREVEVMIKGHMNQNGYFYDLARLSTSLIVAAGFNPKLARGFERLFPAREKKKGKGQIPKKVLDQLWELKKHDALIAAKNKIDGRGVKNSS